MAQPKMIELEIDFQVSARDLYVKEREFFISSLAKNMLEFAREHENVTAEETIIKHQHELTRATVESMGREDLSSLIAEQLVEEIPEIVFLAWLQVAERIRAATGPV